MQHRRSTRKKIMHFFLETDFSLKTLAVIKFSTTSKLSETLHNFMLSLTIAVSNAHKDKFNL